MDKQESKPTPRPFDLFEYSEEIMVQNIKLERLKFETAVNKYRNKGKE